VELWVEPYNASGTINYNKPVRLSGLSGVAGISHGVYHACAWNAVGQVWCWGQNNYGQLGTGNTTDASTPVGVQGL
jgi:alpha-tubulin suppressor-like RCC1 family protein